MDKYVVYIERVEAIEVEAESRDHAFKEALKIVEARDEKDYLGLDITEHWNAELQDWASILYRFIPKTTRRRPTWKN